MPIRAFGIRVLRWALRGLLRLCWRVRVAGIEHYEGLGERALVVANHTSFLDALLLAVFLPGHPTFAIDSGIARAWYMRLVQGLVCLFPMDPANPLAIKDLMHHVRAGHRAVIFPEGRITVTGALMKIYDGPALVADRANAPVLAIHIEGAQYTPFSRLRGVYRLRWFPPIRLTLMPPRRLDVPAELRGRQRRRLLGKALADLMTETAFRAGGSTSETLPAALVEAVRVHGGGHRILEDIDRQPLNYRGLWTRLLILGELLAGRTQVGERVGVLLPSGNGTLVTLLALASFRRVPAMFNFTVGAAGMIAAGETAQLRLILTSRRFVERAKLEAVVAPLAARFQLVYLEDLRQEIGPVRRLRGLLGGLFPGLVQRYRLPPCRPEDPAVVLFTSGTEGAPKGVVLSHANLLSNFRQLAARLDFTPRDLVFNALPLFHSFGLTAGSLLPLFSGVPVFFYPSPLHYRLIPEMVYARRATILFGTNTFLAGYARAAHPYDFFNVRYVFAGAEKLREETRRVWAEKFGLRILEGYGATETSPVLAANTPMQARAGSVGRLMPGIDYRVRPVPGIDEGGRLLVRGPNVMLGYLRHGGGGRLEPPAADGETGWYDTGDIVRVDEDGFIWITGRAKRFAKVGGEMVSLGAVEELAGRCWPERLHAAVALPDPRKGERVILLSAQPRAERAGLLAQAQREGIGEINVPAKVFGGCPVPLLGTGKIDYGAVLAEVQRLTGEVGG
jgi:acyl-[acyl-carrier-protein]-phospholipid O-acyltransferase / long-chain-fatty-acid--[acyl-carrier-protein] ligase